MSRVSLKILVASLAALGVGCLADATLPDDVGARTPCHVTRDCPTGYLCPGVEGATVPVCLPTTRAACGNAVLDDSEACDDGNWIDGDGCRASCTLERCGDAVLDAEEACDDGEGSAACSAQCTRIVCGDARTDAPEACDDGNGAGGDGCSADCGKIEVCGDNLFDEGEACDDGDTESGDGCRGDCGKLEVCGDLIVDDGEACDDGNLNPSDDCNQCAHPRWTARVLTGFGSGRGEPLATPMAFPAAVLDRVGRVILSDGVTHLFRYDELPPDGSGGDRLVPVVGTGAFAFGGDGGPATGAHIDSPMGFDVDDSGRIYLADTGNVRVRVVDTDGVIRTLAGNGTEGFSGDGGPAVLASISAPFDVALDSQGNLFVADTGNCRVRKVTGAADPASATITTVAGDDCTALGGLQAGGLGVDDDDNLLIADPVHLVIWRLPAGTFGPGYDALEIVAGTLDLPGATVAGAALSATFGVPRDVAADGDRFYVADSQHNQVYAVRAGQLTIVAGNGERGDAGDGGRALDAQLGAPRRVYARGGRVLIGDTVNGRLREVDGAGNIRTVAGAPRAPQPRFAFGTSLAIDANGDAFLGDTYQNVLWRVAVDGTVTVVAGTGTPGYSGEGLAAVQSRISSPTSLAFDLTGGLLVAEPNNRRLRRVDPDGTLSTVAGSGNDGDGGLDGAPALGADLGAVNQVAVDPTTGLVWFTVYPTPVIRRINADGTLATPVGSGLPGFGGDGGAGSLARLGNVTDLAFTDDGVLVFADPDNLRVRSYDPLLDIVDTVAGSGLLTFNGDNIDAQSADLDQPTRVAVAADGAILIVDRGSHRVRRVDSGGTITTILGDGTASLFGDGGPSGAARVFEPQDLAVDRSSGAAAGDLAISDVNDDIGVLRRVNSGVIDSVNLLLADGVGNFDQGALATPSAFASLAPANANVAIVSTGRAGLLERVRFDAALSGGGVLDVVAGHPDGFRLGASAVAGGDPFPIGGEARARYLDRLGDACGVVFDGTDALYVADRAQGVVARVHLVDVDDPSTWTVAITVGVPGDRRHNDGPAPTGRLVGPCGLALDASSTILFVTDADDATVRRIDLTDNSVSTLFGVAGLAGHDEDLLDTPMAIARDGNDDLFVADTGNHRVQKLVLAADAVSDVVGVLGTGEAASSGDGAPARTFPVDAPRGLAFDPSGNLLVTSTRTVRLVTADAAGVVDGSGAALTLYGRAPRATFPEDSTFCLAGVDAPMDGVVRVADACQGYLVELQRGE